MLLRSFTKHPLWPGGSLNVNCQSASLKPGPILPYFITLKRSFNRNAPRLNNPFKWIQYILIIQPKGTLICVLNNKICRAYKDNTTI